MRYYATSRPKRVSVCALSISVTKKSIKSSLTKPAVPIMEDTLMNRVPWVSWNNVVLENGCFMFTNLLSWKVTGSIKHCFKESRLQTFAKQCKKRSWTNTHLVCNQVKTPPVKRASWSKGKKAIKFGSCPRSVISAPAGRHGTMEWGGGFCWCFLRPVLYPSSTGSVVLGRGANNVSACWWREAQRLAR